jgi:CDP-diglyceride synthetase
MAHCSTLGAEFGGDSTPFPTEALLRLLQHDRVFPTVVVVCVMVLCAFSAIFAQATIAAIAIGCLCEVHSVVKGWQLRGVAWLWIAGALLYAYMHIERTIYYGLWIGLSDILQYAAGKLIVLLGVEPHFPFPTCSPKKTLEGYLGGMLVVVPMSGGTAVVTSLVVAGMGGDLLASGLKRAVGVKHFATTLGSGIGGLCDRFDSALGMLWCMAAWGVLVGDHSFPPDESLWR